ncbi:MAG: flagellar biosynthesis protein [Rhodothermaceae bacterium]|nr:MAG: flagellar biosynthesis protein [Rhodothermaceae bacterium]
MILAFVSGKGGVGKSVLAVNLAETLCRQGHRVALLDVDLGQGACAVLLNETPVASVLDAVRGKARLIETLHETTGGFTLVQAVAEAAGADGLEHKLFRELDTLLGDLRRTHDVILLDAPAGVDGAVRWALDRADLGLLVLVGEPTAIADAYRLAKFVWQNDPAYPLGALVNYAEDEADARSVAERFSRITAHFTGQETLYFGWVPFSAHIRRSVREQCPAVRTFSPVARVFDRLGRALTAGRPVPLEAPAS